MSWTGTVTCSYCYKRGHNRRSCPDLAERIKNEYESAIEAVEQARTDGHEDNAAWYTQRAEEKRQLYIKRTKIDLATGKKVTNKVAKAERMKKVKCGYCGERGHTRRVCETLKQDFQVYKHLTKRVRAERKRELNELGCGIGSLIPVCDWGYNAAGDYGQHETLRFVTGLRLERIDAHAQDPQVLICKDARNLGPRGEISALNVKRIKDIVRDNPTRVSMTGSKSLTFPEGWEDAADLDVKAAFPVKEGRPYDYAWSGNGDIAEAQRQLGFTDD